MFKKEVHNMNCGDSIVTLPLGGSEVDSNTAVFPNQIDRV